MKTIGYLTIVLLTFVSCSKNDRLVTYYNNDIVKEKYSVIKGTAIEHGLYIKHDIAGNVIERGNFRNGLKHGYWVTFGGSGFKEKRERFKSGVRNGTYTVYHGNGEIMIKGKYKNGSREGKWHTYNRDGSIFLYEIFELDSLTVSEIVNE